MERFSKVLVPVARTADGQLPAAAVNNAAGTGVQSAVEARKAVDGSSELTRSGDSEPPPKVVTAQPRQRFHIYDTVGYASAPPESDADGSSMTGAQPDGEAGGEDANRVMWHMESVSSVTSGTTEGSGGDGDADADAERLQALSASTSDSIFEAQLESQLENADLVPVLRPRSSDLDAGEQNNRDSQLFGSLDQQIQLQFGALDAQEMFGTLDSQLAHDPAQSQSRTSRSMLVPDPGSQFNSIDRADGMSASSLAMHLPNPLADSANSPTEMLSTPLAEQRSILDALGDGDEAAPNGEASPSTSEALQQEHQRSNSQSPPVNRRQSIVSYDPAKCKEKVVLVFKAQSDSLGTINASFILLLMHIWVDTFSAEQLRTCLRCRPERCRWTAKSARRRPTLYYQYFERKLRRQL